jgi:RNA polymerase sigma-70 factor (ECF subfamily)
MPRRIRVVTSAADAFSAAANVTEVERPRDSLDERLTAIYAREGQRLVALGRMLTGSIDAGEDMAQEVFVRALRASRSDPEYLREPVWPWLRTTLVRLVIERHRRSVREMLRLARAYEPPGMAEWPAETTDVAQALRGLPPRMRACVVLHHCEDLTAAETADVIGCAPATVIVHLREARARLRARLDPDGEHARSVARRSRGDHPHG